VQVKLLPPRMDARPNIREAAAVADAAFGAWHTLPLARHMRLEELCREGLKRQRQPTPQCVLRTAFLTPRCGERRQAPHPIHDHVCVGLARDMNGPPDVERALCRSAQGPSVRQGGGTRVRDDGGGARGG